MPLLRLFSRLSDGRTETKENSMPDAAAPSAPSAPLASQEVNTALTLAFGIAASLIALVAVYLAYRQLQVVRHGRPTRALLPMNHVRPKYEEPGQRLNSLEYGQLLLTERVYSLRQ